MLQLVDEDDIDVGNVLFSDKAYFNLDSFVNKQNWRIWGTENPHVAVPSSLSHVHSTGSVAVMTSRTGTWGGDLYLHPCIPQK
ncbi:hypothetical protein AVEN_213261-1 [Araneus ventricosus]|uniref:Uncharacterized protein n=1 Tax=Araneus ventricosus TaxID=182803 RepID=A0A4Y2DFW0_ARAVE|nr:hypothetical protein AVEN_213261-1 [Araneus ventricosus]